MPKPLSVKKRLLFVLVPLVGLYLILETSATAIAWATRWDNSFWLFESSGRTWHFDAVRGYRLTTTPSRFMRVTNGTVEYVGTSRGNVQGFADRDDFAPHREQEGIPRIVVFGDSFTEAQYLGQNWPDREEDLAAACGTPVRLLNMALSGGGLANWWSVLTKLVAAEDYEVDGVLFVVFPGDLRRTFSAWEHRNGAHPLFGRTPGWDPSTYPTTFMEARSFMQEHPGTILGSTEFERALQGHWPRGVPRRFRPFFMTQAWRLLRSVAASADAERDSGAEPATQSRAGAGDPARARLMSDIRQYLTDRAIPAVVVHLPDRDSLLDPQNAPKWPLEEARELAGAIGAEFVDATPAFASLSRQEIKAQFLPYDGHWNQAGSNRFAEFMLERLQKWPLRTKQDASAAGAHEPTAPAEAQPDRKR